ncbi:MAG: Wzt carbohydrate-binding domain-containing protein, partial [Dolichospermum sp.]
TTQAGINFYLQNLETSARNTQVIELPRSGTGDIMITGFSIQNVFGNSVSSVACGEDINLIFHYEARNKVIKNISIGFSIHNIFGDTISILYSDYMGQVFTVES